MADPSQTVVCQICKRDKQATDVVPAELIREPLVETIRKKHPDWSPAGFICFADLNRFRTEHVQDVLETEKGELSAIEIEVVESLAEHALQAENINDQFEFQLTFGERMSDHIAEFGGSWKFLITFAAVLLIWIALNSVVL